MRPNKYEAFQSQIPYGLDEDGNQDYLTVDVEAEYDDGHHYELTVTNGERNLWAELSDDVRDMISTSASERIGEHEVSEVEWSYDSFCNR